MTQNYAFDPLRLQSEVSDFARSVGIEPLDEVRFVFDGSVHRFPVKGDKASEKSGWYVLFSDGWPAGTVGCWRGNISEDWKLDSENLSTEEENYLNSEKCREETERALKRRQELKKQLEKKTIEKVEKTRIYFEGLPNCAPNFPYLEKKNILPFGDMRYCKTRNALAIPLYDAKGAFRSVQWIYEDGTKRFEYETSTKGVFFHVGLSELDKDKNNTLPILVGEGVATMITVYTALECKVPCIAAMNCGNLYEVAQSLKKRYPKRKIIFIADNDSKTPGNPGLTKAIQANELLKLNGFILPKFKRTENGSDWNDYAAIHGREDTAELLKREVKLLLMPLEKRKIYEHVDEINAEVLRHKVFSPLKWAVDGFLSAGLSILAGGPKVGKSTFALHIALSIALGGSALGKIPVQKGRVLYLALEDTKRRLQERINETGIPDTDSIEFLDFTTTVPRQHEGGLEYIKDWLEKHPDARLVIIDTLQRFRKQLSGKNSMYSEDYDVISEIKKLADDYDVAILIIHHLKKAMSDDWLNEISGSQGLAGAADTILSLKRARTDRAGILHVTGRDVEEKDYQLELDSFGWILKGEADEFSAPDWKKSILSYLKEHNSVSPMQLSENLGLGISNAKQSLRRLEKEGLIKKIGYGTYALTDYQL